MSDGVSVGIVREGGVEADDGSLCAMFAVPARGKCAAAGGSCTARDLLPGAAFDVKDARNDVDEVDEGFGDGGIMPACYKECHRRKKTQYILRNFKNLYIRKVWQLASSRWKRMT